MRSKLARLLSLLLFAPFAFGHAVLVKSSLDDQTVPADKPRSVRLVFNVAIEPQLSEVRLLDAEEKPTPLAVQRGPKANELIVQLLPLPTGDYALYYRVLARDGHLTEAALPFKTE